MLDPRALSTKTPLQLVKLFQDLRQKDLQLRLAHFGVLADAGAVLSELHERHLSGKLGKGSWADYCKKLSITKTDAEFLIAAFHGKDDPAAFIEQVYALHEAQEEDRDERATKRKSTVIIVKRFGAVFGYVAELDATARKELWSLCWRNYGREMRAVGDDLGWDDETGDIARPTGPVGHA